MSLSYLLAILARSIIVQRIATYGTGLVVGLGALGVIVEKAGPDGKAVVHVIEADVEVAIGDQAFWVEDRRFEPIVFELTPGRHELLMTRDDQVLYRESFHVKAGSSRVLTAMVESPHAGRPRSASSVADAPRSALSWNIADPAPGHEAIQEHVFSTADR